MKRIGQLKLLIAALTVHFMFSGQPISASTCGTLFSAPKKSVSNPTKEMEITSLNRLAFAVSLLMAHVNGKTRPSLSGNYTSPDHAPIKDFAVPDSALANSFYRAVYPTFYSFHPESVLFLISRGMLPWQVGERLQSIDGGPLQEPYAVSLHDLSFHLPPIISSNISTSTKESTAVFGSLWKGYVNKPGQPVWQRELKIHVLFELLYNEPRSFSVASITRGLETYLQSKSKLDNLTAALSNKDNFASNVLQEQKVTREQLVETMRDLQAWLGENP